MVVLFLVFTSVSPFLSLPHFLSVLLPLTDLDKMDSEKEEMNHADITALHHFYSRHIRDLPDEPALTELFAQVKLYNALIPTLKKHCRNKNMLLIRCSC